MKQNLQNIIPGLTSILVTLLLFFYFQHTAQEQVKIQLKKKTQHLSGIIQSQLQADINAALSFRQHNVEHINLSQSIFNQFSENLISHHPEINNVEWGVLIANDARQAFEQELQRLYGSKIVIKEFDNERNVRISIDKEEYLPIKYTYPLTNNEALLGLEPNPDFADFNALYLARKTAAVMIKGPVIPIQLAMEESNISIISYIPFFHSVDHKPQNFTAYLSLVINIQSFIENILAQNELDEIYIKILDVTTEISQPVYNNSPENLKDHAHYSQEKEIILANKVWSIRLYANQAFINQQICPAYWILLLGAIVTVLLISTQLALQRKTLALQKKINDLTMNSSTAANLLNATFETHQAILLTDINATILRVNTAFTEITGYAEHEALGKNPRILSSGRQSPDFYKAMWQDLLRNGKFEGEIWNRHKNGSIFLEWQTITAVKDKSGNTTHFVSIFADITKKKQEEEKIKHLAFYDPLTLLPNRRLLLDRLEQALKQAQRTKTSGALLSLDIDDFKQINTQLGHHYGDELLIQFAQQLSQLLRHSDTVARLDGDQFVIILPTEKRKPVDVIEHATKVANKILHCSEQEFSLNHQACSMTISIGVALLDYEHFKASDILRQADSALYKAKEDGKHRVCFYQSTTPEQQT